MTNKTKQTQSEQGETKRDPARARDSKKSARKKARTNIRTSSGADAPVEKPLSPKQAAFVEARLRGLSLAESAKAAGYSPKSQRSLEVTGARLMKNAGVAAGIAAGQKETRVAGELTRGEVRRFWASVVRGEVTEQRVVGQGEGAYVEDCEPALRDRLKASELHARSRGMLLEKVEHKVGLDSLMALVDAVAAKPNGVKSGS